MPELDFDLRAIIDDRVRRTLSRPQRYGAFAERTGEVTGTVVEDGTATAMPCLVASDLVLFPGDRVVFCQFGSDWVILASLTPRGTELQYEYTAAGETVVSGSYVDAPGIPAIEARTWAKVRPGSTVIARVDATAFATVASTELQWGVLLTDINTGTTYGPTLIASWFSGNNNRTPHGRQVKITGVPASVFDAKLQWRRPQGTGTVTMNADDRYSFNIREATLQG